MSVAKERMNVTVDTSVRRQCKQRDDFNVSGAVNEYLKRRLAGKDESDAMLEMKIQRHEEQAEDHEEQARQHRQKAENLREKLRDRKQKRRSKLQEAIDRLSVSELNSGTVVTTPDEQVEAIASDADVDPERLREAALSEHIDGEPDDTQRHYQ